LSKRTRGTSSKVRLILGIGGALGVTVVFLVVWLTLNSDALDEGVIDYGFSGEVYRFGQVSHEIVFGEGVSSLLVESVGDYLERVGYFSPAYGGVIQIRSDGDGFDLYLTYPRQYWNRTDFRDEVTSIRDDLEENVLMEATQIILVDEDESGIHSMNLNRRANVL
jgi:hypothetical protein